MDDHIVVTDALKHRIAMFCWDGTFVRAFGSKGAALGELNGPFGVTCDGANNIWWLIGGTIGCKHVDVTFFLNCCWLFHWTFHLSQVLADSQSVKSRLTSLCAHHLGCASVRFS